MELPQMIMLIFLGVEFGINLSFHGKQKQGKYNAWYYIIHTIIVIGLLNWGGFFK